MLIIVKAWIDRPVQDEMKKNDVMFLLIEATSIMDPSPGQLKTLTLS